MKQFDKFKQMFLDTIIVKEELKQVTLESIGIRVVLKVKRNLLKKLFSSRKSALITLSSVISFAVIVTFSSITLVNYLNTPVYEGMTASELTNMQTNSYQLTEPTVNLDMELINDIENQIGVTIDEGISYYATSSEVILITVKINNPNSYEILSFTLNGRLYQSFEFQDGSNSEQIIIRFEVQASSGIESVTIDAIKYVQDTTIKNARFEANKTIQIGVLYEDLPSVTGLAAYAETTSFGMSFVLEDPANLLAAEGSAILFLFDGEKITNVTPLMLGRNVIPYDNLHMGKTYEYAIVATMDILDGTGNHAFILKQNTFTTQQGYAIDAIVPSYESVNFDVALVDQFNSDFKKIEILLEGTVVQTIDTNSESFSITDLNSNTDYQIKLTYEYVIVENDINVTLTDEVISSFTTTFRPLPTLSFGSQSSDLTSIGFDLNISDTNTLGSVIKTDLYLGDTLVDTQNTLVNAYTDLLSNQAYKVVVTYQYDLEDGQGFQTLQLDTTISTLAKVEPTYTINNLTADETTVNFNYDVVDLDQTATIDSIELWDASGNVATLTDLSTTVFSNLLSNHAYEVRVYYHYNLNEGHEDVSTYISSAISTLAVTKPTVIFTSAAPFNTTLYSFFKVTDPASIINIVRFELYLNGVLINQKTAYTYNATNMTGNVDFTVSATGNYKVIAVYEYDLNDGLGVQTADYSNHLSQLNYISFTK